MVARRFIAVAAALALTGCEAGGSEGPEEQAHAAAQTFLEDCARGDVVAAMDVLTEPVRAELVASGSGLEACLRIAGLAPAGEEPSPEESRRLLGEARVVGVGEGFGEQFATATIEAGDGSRHEIELDQRGELWRIATPPR